MSSYSVDATPCCCDITIYELVSIQTIITVWLALSHPPFEVLDPPLDTLHNVPQYLLTEPLASMENLCLGSSTSEDVGQLFVNL